MATVDDITMVEKEDKVTLSNQKGGQRRDVRGVHFAWASGGRRGSVDSSLHESSRGTRDGTFASRNPCPKPVKSDGFNFQSNNTPTRSCQLGLFEGDIAPHSRAKRRNSVSTYLPSQGVNDKALGSDYVSSARHQGIRNTFPHVKSLDEPTLRKEKSWNDASVASEVDGEDLQPPTLNLRSGFYGGRRVTRRHSVTSLSSSYSDDFSPRFDRTGGYLNTHRDSCDLSHSDPWCWKCELKNGKHLSREFSEQSGKESPDWRSRWRRQSVDFIKEKDATDNELVGENDDSIAALVQALKRDIKPQKLTDCAKNSDKTHEDLRNHIRLAKGSDSLRSNPKFSAGLNSSAEAGPAEFSRSSLVIHLPDSGARSVSPSGRSETSEPSRKDTHVSVVSSKDISVTDSLDDVLKCVQSGLGTTVSSHKIPKHKPVANRDRVKKDQSADEFQSTDTSPSNQREPLQNVAEQDSGHFRGPDNELKGLRVKPVKGLTDVRRPSPGHDKVSVTNGPCQNKENCPTDTLDCVTFSHHREDPQNKKVPAKNDNTQEYTRNTFVKAKDFKGLENGPRNTQFDGKLVRFEQRSTGLDSNSGRHRGYSLDSGKVKKLVRQNCISEGGEETGINSDISTCPAGSDSDEEPLEPTNEYTALDLNDSPPKKPASKIKRSLTSPDLLVSPSKKTARRNHPRNPSFGDIYTISEEISPDGVSTSLEEKGFTNLGDRVGNAEDDPESVDLENASQRLRFGEGDPSGPQHPQHEVELTKGLSFLRRKSLYDVPDIFEKLVCVDDAVDDNQSKESILSCDISTATSDSVFDRVIPDVSSSGETNSEQSDIESGDDIEDDDDDIYNRFFLGPSSSRRATIDVACLDQVNRAGKVNTVPASSCLSDHYLLETRDLQNDDGQIMGYEMAQNQSSENFIKSKEVKKSKGHKMHDHLKEYKSKFGGLSTEQELDRAGEVLDGRPTVKSGSDSPLSSILDLPQQSRTAQALANPNIIRFLKQSHHAMPGARPSSRSSSPQLSDSGRQSPKTKNMLTNTEFFFSSSEDSPCDSPKGSTSDIGTDELVSHKSSGKDNHDAGHSPLHQRRSSSDMNLDQLCELQSVKTDSSKSGRSRTDPFPDASRSPREILELSASGVEDSNLPKRHSDAAFQDVMKRSALKSKFHIPTFEEFKLKKKTTISSTPDYFGHHEKHSKHGSHQPMKGVHSKHLAEQMRHSKSTTAVHELGSEQYKDDHDGPTEGRTIKHKKVASAGSQGHQDKQKQEDLNERVSRRAEKSESGVSNGENVLKAPPRRRHRSSDGRKNGGGMSPRGGNDTDSSLRPKSVAVKSATLPVAGRNLQREGSDQMLDIVGLSGEALILSPTDDYYQARQVGSCSVPGVTVTESEVDTCDRPNRPEKRPRKKSKSMIELSKSDVQALERLHQNASDLSGTNQLSPGLRSQNSEHDLQGGQGQGHVGTKTRHRSGEKLTKTKSEPRPVVFVNEDGHKRSKSEKSRRVKESHKKQQRTESVGDIASREGATETVSSCDWQHLNIDNGANVPRSTVSPVSPREDSQVGYSRKSKSKSYEKHKSTTRSTDNLTNQEISVPSTLSKKLSKAQSMSNLYILDSSGRQESGKRVKGQRPVSMGLPVDIDFENDAFDQMARIPGRTSGHVDEGHLAVPCEKDNKSFVIRSTSDVTDSRKDGKQKHKKKKVRSSKSDPFDEKGRRAHSKVREHIHQQLGADSSEFLESSLSFQSIGDIDEDETSSEIPLKKSSGRKPKKISNVSTTSVDSGVIGHDGSHDNDDLSPCKDGTFSIEVERVDSGVGSETKYSNKKNKEQKDGIVCSGCEKLIPHDDIIGDAATVCTKCLKQRRERKETIQEIIDTEVSYGRDLKIIKEEFFKPMENASLLTAEQTQTVFLNLQELMDINDKFADFLQDAVENADEQGDEDYQSVQMGKIFLDFSFMFIAFENYCVNQSSASLLLEQMEKERELLRIFLQVSQRDNQLLRRMNLKSFLMVPVQRIVKYPLLLTRLYKSTPHHNTDRELIKEAQMKIEEILDHINASTKGGKTKASTLRRGTPGTAAESVEIQKVAFETIGKNRNEAFCVMMGRLNYATPTENVHWTKKGKGLKFNVIHAVLLAIGKNKSEYSVEEDLMLFPKKSHISETLVVLLKEKNGKYVPARDPLSLDKCVVSVDADFDEVFEVHEINKETLFFKADDTKENITWVRHLKYQAKDVGAWRRRRPALANIMFNKS